MKSCQMYVKSTVRISTGWSVITVKKFYISDHYKDREMYMKQNNNFCNVTYLFCKSNLFSHPQ